MPTRVLILGSTGSIGEQALDVISRSSALEVAGLSAARNWERLLEQALQTGTESLALSDPEAAERAAGKLDGTRILAGEAGVRELIAAAEPDLVLNAIVGIAGLGPTIVALSQGTDVALANKESLVVGGDLVTALAEAGGARILPVDSEHSALQQLLAGAAPGTADRLVLTASGGPFRGRTDLGGITPDEALAHPTWDMGGRITVDSATLINKGFEVIEAHHLFGIPYERIQVVVHPQSIVHALVNLNDGASLAHLGYPDMRVPISYALHRGEREDVPVRALDLAEVGELRFERPDVETFRCLRLARDAGEAGGTAPAVLNAADEVAVAAFLAGQIPFASIPEIVSRALEALPVHPPAHFEDLFEADRRAREVAGELVGSTVRCAGSLRSPGSRH
jgi:1-deoxy-D-xylulose-5-phosphate reductoisomerase